MYLFENLNSILFLGFYRTFFEFLLGCFELDMKSFIASNHGFLVLLVLMCLLFLGKCQGESSIAPMKEKEQQALYSAIQAFVGKSWNGSDLYPDPCGWTPIQGVSCDLFGDFWYVTVIIIGSFTENSLQCTHNARFTDHLFKLNHLKSLTFFNCFTSPSQNPTKIPSSNLYELSNTLESLEFRSNPGLIGRIPRIIGCLKKLQSLVLMGNGLAGSVPVEIGNLVKLKRLVLMGSHFSGMIPASFGGLRELLILDLSRNNLSGSLPLTFGALTSLLKLDLSNNLLEGKLPVEIKNLKNVTLLDLRNNNFSGGLVQSFEAMDSLKEMALSNNPIGGNLLGIQWEKLQNLEILDLSNMGLMGSIPESMADLKKIRFLGLNGNNLTGRVSSKLGNLPYLNALYIYGNSVKGKLEFSAEFYEKMRRRFGAWNNPNLCYEAELVSTSYIPYGVKLCQ